MEYVSSCFKTAQIIMLHKKGKPVEEVTSYRPIPLLPVIPNCLKNLLKRLKPFFGLPY